MVKAFIIYGILVGSLLAVANARGWYMGDVFHPGNWGSRQGGVYYHGTGFYHK